MNRIQHFVIERDRLKHLKYSDGRAYEVEFVTLDGHTAAVVTLDAGHVRPLTRREMPHAREL